MIRAVTGAKPVESPDEVRQFYRETRDRIDQLYADYERIQATQARLKRANEKALHAEGDRLQEELRQLEAEFGLTLLFNLGDAARECWQEVLRQDRFWNIVRFFGLGFALGLLVKALTG
ncbi:hypothetical protein RYO59_001300 [Thermosynechococcaceae cyanobacterium Okahandja]